MLQKLITQVGIFSYDIKFLQEMAWAGAVGAATVGLQLLVTTDPEQVTDWQTWAIAAGAALVRAFVAAALGRKPS